MIEAEGKVFAELFGLKAGQATMHAHEALDFVEDGLKIVRDHENCHGVV